ARGQELIISIGQTPVDVLGNGDRVQRVIGIGDDEHRAFDRSRSDMWVNGRSWTMACRTSAASLAWGRVRRPLIESAAGWLVRPISAKSRSSSSRAAAVVGEHSDS